MIRTFSILAIALLSATAFGTADAQMIRRAENASVRFVPGMPEGLEQPRIVAAGETVWTETVSPTHAVRLTGPAPERNRPRHADGVPEGAILFGVHLSDSVVYCQPIAYDEAVRRVQCYRDLDGNGTFDGAYLTRQRGLDSRFLVAFVHALTAAPQIPYEPVEPQHHLSTRSRIVLDVERGAPVFRRYIDEERLDAEFSCTPVAGEPGVCSVLGVKLRIEPEGDAFRISSVAVAPNRAFAVQITNTGL